jgi:hypothetical protein
MTQERTESEIRRLLDEIDLQYQSAFLGLSGLSSGSSRHDFINHRLEKIEGAREQLVDLLGEDTAGRLIVEQMNKTADRHKGEN